VGTLAIIWLPPCTRLAPDAARRFSSQMPNQTRRLGAVPAQAAHSTSSQTAPPPPPCTHPTPSFASIPHPSNTLHGALPRVASTQVVCATSWSPSLTGARAMMATHALATGASMGPAGAPPNAPPPGTPVSIMSATPLVVSKPLNIVELGVRMSTLQPQKLCWP
jgi:hypothetical protein